MPLFQHPDDVQVGVLDELPRKVRHVGPEFAAPVDGMDRRETVFLGCLVVVFPVRRGHVDDAGAVIGGDEPGFDDVKRLLPDRMVVEYPVVLHSGKCLPRKFLQHRVFPLEHTETRFGKYEVLPPVRDLDVGNVRRDGECDVGDQCPGGGRPDEEGRVR